MSRRRAAAKLLEDAAEAARGDALRLRLGRRPGLWLGRPLEQLEVRLALGELCFAKSVDVFVPVLSGVYSGLAKGEDVT